MKNIVTIGGGTGSFTLLSGLKKYPVNIAAIVSMADDGGSTGRLRDELGVLPPGDVRQCLVALSDSSETLRQLMNYRFENGGLKGHNFGNLLLSALEKIKGDFVGGLDEAAKILSIKGSVIPVSGAKMNMMIELNNGKILKGENNLDHDKEARRIGVKRIFIRPRVEASRKAIKAIRQADMIIIGPGDHYGSIIPNLLTRGLCDEIYRSGAKVVYNCNLTNKKGQTDNFTLHDYVVAINSYFKRSRIDYVIVPTRRPAEELIARYEAKEGSGSIVDFSQRLAPEERDYQIVRAAILRRAAKADRQRAASAGTSSFIRHDPDRLAKTIMEVLDLEEGKVIKEII
jgi:uncharacterized cofD-like protein